MRQVRRLLLRAHARQRPDRRRAAGAALVEHQDAEVLERAGDPRQQRLGTGRPRRLGAGAALQVDEERLLEPRRLGDLAREDRDPVAVGSRVVERHRELVLGQDEPGDPMLGHESILSHNPPMPTNYERAFEQRPEVYAAWQQLNGAIKGGMDLRRYELATLAAARRLRSSYCCLAHGSVLLERFGEPVREIALDH